MENSTGNIIGGIILVAPALLIILKVFAAEYVTNFTKQLFKSKTNKAANGIFKVIIGSLILVGAIFILSPLFSDQNPQTNTDEPDQQNIPQKSKDELIAEGLTMVYKDGKEVWVNKKKNDSTIIANRGKKFVYQIGNIKDNEEAVLNLVKRLKNISERIFAFKISRNQYFVYEDDEYSEDQIQDSLASFKSRVDSIEPEIHITDLMQYCNAKEQITETKSLKSRKEKAEVSCCNCDK